MKSPSRIKKILVANRGEIAVRIISTCRTMGMRTVAVCSDIDRDAPHVRLADESYLLGPSPARESYLTQSKILEIAVQAQANPIHAGCGFPAENAGFVESVVSRGLTFIGPTAQAIRGMGDKTAARKLAISLGIPVVPGTPEPVQGIEEVIECARKIKYPILLKAAGGGGGKGMRLVSSDEELASALQGARSEARSSFADDRVYVEKYIENPRHIEVQILADSEGNAIHLGERECSIQRRHQKIIEESPSVVVDGELRTRLTEAALQLVRAGNYTNAGTIEFILDKDRQFYFLEMNTRLQVEHPVTEMRTGIDMVREQIHIAEGKRISLRQEDIRFHGHAIESRIYAEDSLNAFLPSTGTIHWLKSPRSIGIREDRGVEEGSDISAYYDPMIAKLIAWGSNRDEAIQRLTNALKEYELYGVRNNINLCLWVLNNSKFRSGDIHTNLIRDEFSASALEQVPVELARVAAIMAARSHMDRSGSGISPTRFENANHVWNGSGWKSKLRDNMK